MHFSWFFRYMEEAEHALWRAAGLTIATAGEEVGYPRMAASCAFHAPLRFEDEIDLPAHVLARFAVDPAAAEGDAPIRG